MERFHGIYDHFKANIDTWKEYCDTPDPQNQPLPDPWNKKLTDFEVNNLPKRKYPIAASVII